MLLIYTDDITPRISYIFPFLLTDILGLGISITNKPDEFETYSGPRLNYSLKNFESCPFIRPHALLFSQHSNQPSIEIVEFDGHQYFCSSSPDSLLPFDPFAASFFLISRMEEYAPTQGDNFGRFRPSDSILWRNRLLKKPVVNIWARLLGEKLQAHYPQLHISTPSFQFISTIDIDNAWAYRHKGLVRTLSALLRTLTKAPGDLGQQLKILSGKIPDPYDTYAYLDQVFNAHKEQVRFFITVGNYGPYDKNPSHRNKHYRELIYRLGQNYQVGIHPSFAAGKNQRITLIAREIKRLENILGRKISSSRQHFLLLDIPQTYKNLIACGITEDFTMGYASETGFRAGTCTPFFFYDLENEQTTTLKIFPFQVMDGTLRHYKKLTVSDAIEESLSIMKEVKNTGGTFVCIWHNETVNDRGQWKGYRKVFEKIHQEALTK